ncbi:MAG TPA: hypothetical protein VMB72_08585 [Acidimicrobiales bacterium]|nr:hypothetical protein [Acidimicrobiales bacterium]
MVTIALTTAASAATSPTTTAPFNECPAIGDDTSCGLLVDITPSGIQVLGDATQGPYDGADDTLVGVLNQSTAPVSDLSLSSSTENIFGFDGDGICSGGYGTWGPAPASSTVSSDTGSAGCAYDGDMTTYAGPDTSFSDYSSDGATATSGTVNFPTPLGAGQSTYFSLEEALTTSSILPPTSIATSLSGGGKAGTTVSVPADTAVTDAATLSGTNAGTATGTVTYDVYSDAACSVAVRTGTAETITTPGTPPASSPVSLPGAGTYYWQVSYSGDAANGASTSACGSEIEKVSGGATTLTTSLSGGGKSGTAITVPAGTAVTDAATLSGPDVATATGTVTYSVYSDSACTMVVDAGSPQTITTPGALPTSAPVSLSAAGTYYWQASYSGDTDNAASLSPCTARPGADEVETVMSPTPAAMTKLRTSLSDGTPCGSRCWGDHGRGWGYGEGWGHYGDSILTVDVETTVTDSATLFGSNATAATGTVTYAVYSDPACTAPLATGTPETITTPGVLPASSPLTIGVPGTYYWQAAYSGDAKNGPSMSKCGSEIEIVTLAPTRLTTDLVGSGNAGGGKSFWLGDRIDVFSGAAVTDSATLSGPEASSATGTVTYVVYGDPWHRRVVASGGTVAVTAGAVPDSTPVTLTVPGTYYWQAVYTGDGLNAPSASWNSEIEVVSPVSSCTYGWNSGWNGGCRSQPPGAGTGSGYGSGNGPGNGGSGRDGSSPGNGSGSGGGYGNGAGNGNGSGPGAGFRGGSGSGYGSGSGNGSGGGGWDGSSGGSGAKSGRS